MVERVRALVAATFAGLAACTPAGSVDSLAGAAPMPLSRVALEGDGRGDYLFADVAARRLYVTHSARVHILNLDTLVELAQVRGLTRAQGVAPVAALGRGFVTDGAANQVVMFDLTTGATLKQIAAGQRPDSIVYDPASGMILAFGGASEDALVIDPRKGELIKTIPLGDKPEFSRADGRGKVWVNLEGTGQLGEIDTRAMVLAAKHPLAGCQEPSALALDAARGLLYTTCSNSLLAVVSAATGALVASAPSCEDADGAAYDPVRQTVYVACRGGTLAAISRDRAGAYHTATFPTEVLAKTLTFDPRRGRLFSSTADLVWPGGKVDTTGTVRPQNVPGSFHVLVIG